MLTSGNSFQTASSGNKLKVLEAFDLYRFYHAAEEETLALRGVSIHVDAGEIVAVVGPSGSGKSTLLACLAGLDEPNGGHVHLMGKRLTRRPETERASARANAIGVMMQSGNLFDHLTVEGNIRLPMRLGHRQDTKRVSELLQLVGLDQRRSARPTQISGGEAARAALAVALANEPQLLLADEPTGEVDATTEQMIMHLLEAYRDKGGAAIIATHSEALMGYANRIVRLLDGKVMLDE